MPTFKQEIKTQVGELHYIFAKGDGRNTAMPGEPENYQYVASIITKKDSPLHKDMAAKVKAVWEEYSKLNNLKIAPASTGIKPVMVDSDKLDEYGAPIKVESGNVIINFKTNVKWKPTDAKNKDVLIYDGKGNDITAAHLAAPWSIGNESMGIIHGVAMGNNVGGKHKVTLYLTAIQLTKLVKYTGVAVDITEVEGAEELDLGDTGCVAAADAEVKPEI